MSGKDPKDVASEASSNLIRMALVVLAMVGVVVYFISTGRVQFNEPVELTARIAQPTTWTETGPLTLTVGVTLVNNQDEPLQLETSSQCNIFRWFLTDDNRDFIQSQRADDACIDVPVRGELEGKHTISGEYTLTLDPARVKPGDYIIFLNYWGHELRQKLTIN